MSLYGATRSAIPQPVLTAVYAATGLPREQKKRDYEAKLKDRFKEAPEVTAKPFSFFFFAIPPDFFACGSDAGSSLIFFGVCAGEEDCPPSASPEGSAQGL
eukprot:3941618-Rhodomonas_salina.1